MTSAKPLDNPHPESVPVNVLSKVPGTPLAGNADVPIWETVRMIAAARILMPRAVVRPPLVKLSTAEIACVRQALVESGLMNKTTKSNAA